jgi:hypothetical protein
MDLRERGCNTVRQLKVTVADNAQIAGVIKASLSDIK